MAERNIMSIKSYRECLRKHAASLGSYATDGCGEFTSPSDAALLCAACGCHRNFHRRVTYSAAASRGLIELKGGGIGSDRDELTSAMASRGAKSGSSKRFRTKFTLEQKEKMLGFAEKIGWRLQRKDLEEEIERFCRSVGVTLDRKRRGREEERAGVSTACVISYPQMGIKDCADSGYMRSPWLRTAQFTTCAGLNGNTCTFMDCAVLSSDTTVACPINAPSLCPNGVVGSL